MSLEANKALVRRLVDEGALALGQQADDLPLGDRDADGDELRLRVTPDIGGVATDDVIRSLTISQRALGTRSVVLIHHTNCGLESLTEEFRHDLEMEVGQRPAWAVEAFFAKLTSRRLRRGSTGSRTLRPGRLRRRGRVPRRAFRARDRLRCLPPCRCRRKHEQPRSEYQSHPPDYTVALSPYPRCAWPRHT